MRGNAALVGRKEVGTGTYTEPGDSVESRKFAKRCVDYTYDTIAACCVSLFLIMARIYAVCEGWLYE